MLTHYNLVAQIRVLFRHGDPEAVINVTPLFATYALSIIMGGHFHVGNTIVLLSRFEPSIFLQAIQDYKVSFRGASQGKLGEPCPSL